MRELVLAELEKSLREECLFEADKETEITSMESLNSRSDEDLLNLLIMNILL
jgi:hypothetical protein